MRIEIDQVLDYGPSQWDSKFNVSLNKGPAGYWITAPLLRMDSEAGHSLPLDNEHVAVRYVGKDEECARRSYRHCAGVTFVGNVAWTKLDGTDSWYICELDYKYAKE
jgi:hypothetical protein